MGRSRFTTSTLAEHAFAAFATAGSVFAVSSLGAFTLFFAAGIPVAETIGSFAFQAALACMASALASLAFIIAMCAHRERKA